MPELISRCLHTQSAQIHQGGDRTPELLLLREGMASLLERSGIQAVGQAGDAIQLLPLIRDTSPHLVVIDIRMPPTRTREGLQAARQIREQYPGIGILVLSAHAEVEHAMELLATSRGIGYLLKSRVTDVTEFVDILERIAKGDQSSTRRRCRRSSRSPPH